MGFYVSGAILGSTVVGAISSDKASKENSKGIKKGLEQSAALSNQARQEVMALFNKSAQNQQLGMKAALDYYKTAAPKRMTPLIQANQQAQNVIGQGAVQANNAILGLPVDMGFTQQQPVGLTIDHMTGAQIPVYEQANLQIGENAPQPSPAAPQKSGGSSSGGLLGVLGGLSSKSPAKKLIKKIF